MVGGRGGVLRRKAGSSALKRFGMASITQQNRFLTAKAVRNDKFFYFLLERGIRKILGSTSPPCRKRVGLPDSNFKDFNRRVRRDSAELAEKIRILTAKTVRNAKRYRATQETHG